MTFCLWRCFLETAKICKLKFILRLWMGSCIQKTSYIVISVTGKNQVTVKMRVSQFAAGHKSEYVKKTEFSILTLGYPCRSLPSCLLLQLLKIYQTIHSAESESDLACLFLRCSLTPPIGSPPELLLGDRVPD